jgi:hypothetical protein
MEAVHAAAGSDESSNRPGDRQETRRRTAIVLLVLLVLAGSAAAFAVSEHLKVQRSAITGTHVDKVISPVCDCPTARATIAFRLTRAGRLSLGVVDSGGRVVRTLVRGREFGRGNHHFTWNGRDDDGAVVPEGAYRPRIRIAGLGRTLVLPNPIQVDATSPRITAVEIKPQSFSPDGDGRADVVRVSYRISEHAHALLYVNGRQRVRTRFQPTRGEMVWYGKVAGKTLPPGRYRLSLAAEDRAGNRSKPVNAGAVELRYVQLSERSLTVRPGRRLTLRVSTDVKRVRWTLYRGSSVVERGSGDRALVLRAPVRPGRYVLVVEAGRYRARSAVVVRRS